jgi:hypothetical protein
MQGDVGVTGHVGLEHGGGRAMQICVGIDAAKTTHWAVAVDDGSRIALRLKVGRRRDLVEDQTRRIGHLRGLLCGIHPGLEWTLGLTCEGPLALVSCFVKPAEFRRASKRRIVTHLRKPPHLHGIEAITERVLEAAHAQRIAVPGETATAELVRELALEVR